MSGKKMYGYNLHGLRVNSELRFEVFEPKNVYKFPHAILKFGKVDEPKKGIEDTFYGPFTVANENFFFQNIPSIAKYLIEGKDKVTIDIYNKDKLQAAQVFFVDSILPLLLIKNEKFAVHASAVKTKKGVFLFTAPRGNGKSSIASALILTGAKLISDDICILKWDKEKEKFYTKCHHSNMQLWQNMFPIFGKRLDNFNKTNVRKGLLKFNFDFSKHALKEYSEVAGIIFLNVTNEDKEIDHNEVKGITKINMSRNIIHTSQVSKYVAQHKQLFLYSSQIAKNLDLIVLNRSRIINLRQLAKYVIGKIVT